MDQKHLIIERTYQAPIARVWEAITNKDQMKQWYFDVSDFKPEVGFEFQFIGDCDGRIYNHQCKVLECNPITKIAYTWTYENYVGESVVTFELFSEDVNKTRLKLTHSGLDTFPQDLEDFSRESFNGGWNYIIGESLENFVETESYNQSIRIQASLKDIWEILLNPNNHWGLAFGEGTIAETDWKQGSAIIWKDTEGNVGATGVVEINQPESELQLHYYDEYPSGEEPQLGDYYEKFKLEVGSSADGNPAGKTGSDSNSPEIILTIEAGELSRYCMASHKEMWDKALQMIKELAEKKG